MNNLEKLIEQYERKTGEKAFKEYTFPGVPQAVKVYQDDFVKWLSSRLTCGVEQRKFLDEIEKKSVRMEFGIKPGKGNFLSDDSFECDLQKVIQGE